MYESITNHTNYTKHIAIHSTVKVLGNELDLMTCLILQLLLLLLNENRVNMCLVLFKDVI